MNGTILDSRNNSIEVFDVKIATYFDQDNMRIWLGSFRLPPDKHLKGSEYKLILEDGRSGNILVNTRFPLGYSEYIRRVRMQAGNHSIVFLGTGKFE